MTLDAFDRAVYAHLTGYAVIAVVLASSSFVGPIGEVVGYAFGLGVAVTLIASRPALLSRGDDVEDADDGPRSAVEMLERTIEQNDVDGDERRELVDEIRDADGDRLAEIRRVLEERDDGFPSAADSGVTSASGGNA